MMRHFLNFQIHYSTPTPIKFQISCDVCEIWRLFLKEKTRFTQELTAGHIQVIGKTENSELDDLVLIFQKRDQYLWL